MTFQKGVKFKIYPNREQSNLIDRTLGCSRLIYNKGLAMREDAFKSGEKCGYKQTSAMLTALKQDVNYAFLKEVDSIALQQALRNLDTGYTNFFEHNTMNEQNFVEDTQDSTEDIQYQAYVALVEDFKEFIDTTVKAGKDSYKHVDLFNGKPLEESVTHTVPLEDDKAQLLAAACMDLANSTLWLYYHQNKFKDTEFAEVVNNNYPKYQVRVQQEMNQEGGQFYLRSWYSLAQKISRECQLKAFEGYKPKEQMTYVNIYLLVYAAMKSLKNGSLRHIMANVEHDSDKIGNLAFYFFTYILEVLERPLG